MVLDLNNNKETAAACEMRERKGRRESREIPEREVFERAEPRVRRKVSRVESLKRILFSRTETEEKKRRSKSAEAELKRSTVDKGCGPDMDEEMFAARASCLDLSSEIGEFDSVSQISCMDNHDRWHFIRRNGSMSVSSDVLSGDDHSTVVSSHVAARRHNQFPYAYLKSKLTTLPEELSSGSSHGRLQYGWQESQDTAASQSEVGSASKHSGLAPSQRLKMLAIRRKKSQSLADLHDKNIVGREAAPCKSAEESGYDSDTRKSAETVSPKSSDKSDESDSGQDSGSFPSDNSDKHSDTDPDTEPHYQVRQQQEGEDDGVDLSVIFPGSPEQLPPHHPPETSPEEQTVWRGGGRPVPQSARPQPGPGERQGEGSVCRLRPLAQPEKFQGISLLSLSTPDRLTSEPTRISSS